MSAIIRKNLNFRNIHRLKILFATQSHNFTFSQYLNPCLFNSGFRRFAAKALLNYDNYGVKEIVQSESANNSPMESIENAFTELDNYIQRKGRCNKFAVEEILSTIKHFHFATGNHGLYLLRSCGLMYTEKPDERVKFANTIWKKLNEIGVPLDVRHFNSLLKIFVDCNHKFLPSEFLVLMENSKIEPNNVTYLHLLQKYCNDGNLNGASEVLQCLKEKELPINELVFNTLITGHMRANDTSGAKDILEVMRKANLSPTPATYTAIACGYAEKGEIEDVKSILNEAKSNNIVLSNTNYLSIITSLSSDENPDFVDELLKMMPNLYEWKQEVANAMITLINKNMDNYAFKLLLAIATPESNFPNLFGKQLINNDKPAEEVIKFCEEIFKQGLQNNIFFNSIRAAVNLKKPEILLALIESDPNKNSFVQPQLFHALLSCFKNKEEGIWLTLKKMFQFGVPADLNIYSNYVFPAVTTSCPESVLSEIEKTGHSLTTAIDPLLKYYCYHGEFANALYIIQKYPVTLSQSFFNIENFLNSRVHKDNKNNSEDYYQVVSFLLKNVGAFKQDHEVAFGRNLAALIQINPSLFENLLDNSDKQFEVSNKSLLICRNILRKKNPKLLNYIRRLNNFESHSKGMTDADEVEKLNLLKEKGLSTSGFLIERLHFYLKQKNIPKINELKEELDKVTVQYPPSLLAELLNFHSANGDLEQAQKSFSDLKENYPSFKLDSVKVFSYASLLIKYSKFDDAINVVNSECKDLHYTAISSLLKSLKKLLTIAVETGSVDLVKNLQSSLLNHTEFLHLSYFHDPLLKICLYKNDLNGAIEEFRRCIENHQIAPCLRLFMKKCIIMENPVKLESVIQIASTLLGREVVLYELVITLLKLNRESEAMKVMENLRTKNNSGCLEDFCINMYNLNQKEELIEFVKFICVADHVNRESIVQCLLKLNDAKNDFKTAVNLYNVTKDLFQLNDETRNLLFNLLSRNKQNVPFTVPETNYEGKTSFVESEVVSKFLQNMNEEDAHQALKQLQNMKKVEVRSISLDDMSKFLDMLLQKRCLNDLSKNVHAMDYIKDNMPKILKPLLEKYSSSGDVDAINEIKKNFPELAFIKNYYSKAYIVSERYEDLLFAYENNLNEGRSIFKMSAFLDILKKPHLEERAISLAKKYKEQDQDFDLPITAVWAHCLTNEHYRKAEEFCKVFSVSAHLVGRMVSKVAREKENVTMAMNYLSAIKDIDCQKKHKENAYGTLLDILVLKEMYDDASLLVVEAQEKDINLEKYYRSTLVMLKNALQRERKNVPFTIQSEDFAVPE